MKLFGAMLMMAGLALGGAAFAADSATKPSSPACCGEKCAKMPNCCKVVDGKDVCSMGGGCCIKK